MRITSERDDATDRQRFDQHAFGEHDPETAGELEVVDGLEIGAVELDPSPQRRLHACQRAQQCRLADAVRTEQADELAGADRQVDALEHRAPLPSRAITDREVVRRQCAHPANAPRRLRRSTATTTGAPISEVTAFSGSTPALPGSSATIC